MEALLVIPLRGITCNANLQNKSLKLWSYILELDLSKGTMDFYAASRIDDFLTKGYNNYVGKRNAAYDSKSNPLGLGLAGTKYALNKWESTNPVENGVFVSTKDKQCEFAEREYNLHYLDLMLTVYAAAVKNNATSEVKNAWEQAIIHYVSGDQTSKDKVNGEEIDEYSVFNAGAPIISISGGVIARGLQQGSDGKFNGQGAVVYVGSQDLTIKPV